ncbi:leucine-rich repeat-containing protein 59-like [Teleopsis dalmanni]|uniref:leucine-rich repeat-containing protein 59-like n=1 Tax=Teleopsis dalmanni TaxID=139649 RepID=UPI0018CD3BD9|nr:leucine-rich repeat-containing protein 59-like [Teleopsis dalmanni]
MRLLVQKKYEAQKVKRAVSNEMCNLSHAELVKIPILEISKYNVKVLDLHNNSISSINDTFGRLKTLIKLDLSANKLTTLPSSIGQLFKLRSLTLYDNCLTDLPISFGRLSKLRYLNLHNNPLSEELKAVTGCCFTSKDCQKCAVDTVQYYKHKMRMDRKRKQEITEYSERTKKEEPTPFFEADIGRPISTKVKKMVQDIEERLRK